MDNVLELASKRCEFVIFVNYSSVNVLLVWLCPCSSLLHWWQRIGIKSGAKMSKDGKNGTKMSEGAEGGLPLVCTPAKPQSKQSLK